MTGRFITFEGGDGAGKTTLIKRVHEALLSRGEIVIHTREPGDTAAGKAIRELLLHQMELKLTARAELLLYLADRAQHVEEMILPALRGGKVVLCDRFNDSTMAYQGAARGLDLAYLKDLCSFVVDGLKPDLTIYLDLDPQIGLERLKQLDTPPDRIERESLAFHIKIRHAYHQFAQEEPARFYLVDATQAPDEVFSQTIRRIDALLFTHR